MANPTQAPTLEKGALTPADQAMPVSAEQQALLAAAFRFGWALEELVWRLNDMARQEQAVAPPSTPASLDFPPDLTHQRSPAEHIREVRKLLQVEGRKVLGDAQSVSAGTIGTRIDALLQTYEQKQSVVTLLTGPDRIGSFVRLWDADVVDSIIDQPPELLTAYELGKALSLTSWHIWTAQTSTLPAAATTDPVADAWQASLNKTRVEQIRRHLNTLATAMDPRIVVSVSASLSFWRRAYEFGDLGGAAAPDPKNPIPADAVGRATLQHALDQQLATWYDLLAGRRRLDSFPVTAIVSSLMRDYAQTRWSGPGAAVILIIGIGVVVVLVGVAVWAALGGNAAAGAGAGLTGGLTSLVGFFVARGAGLLDRGSRSVQELQARVSQIQAQLAATAAAGQAQPAQLTFESLGRSVLGQVVAQIRLEEAKLAISQPLIDYITQADRNKGPEQGAKDFLQKIMENDEQSNMERLQNVLEGLYQGYRPLVPGAQP